MSSNTHILSRLNRKILTAGIVIFALAAVTALALPAIPTEGRSNAPTDEAAPPPQITQNPELSVAAEFDTVVEGGWAQFTISANPAPTGSLTVHYTVSQTGEFEHYAKQLWIDKNLGNKTLTLTGSSATIAVPTVDDNRFERDGSVTVTLGASSAYTLSASSSATITRLENEAIPTLSISGETQEINEGDTARFTLSTKPKVGVDVTVNYRVMQNGDYVYSGNLGEKQATIAGSGGAVTVTTISEDGAPEPDGAVIVMLLPSDDYRLGNPNVAYTIMRNTSVTPQLSVSAAAQRYTEGNTAQFTVSADPAPSRNLEVNYRVTQNGDYVSASHTGSRFLVLTGASADISAPTVDDGEHEGAGSVLVTLLPGNGYTLSKQNTARATITNNDPLLPAITVSGGAGIDEGGTANYVISASPAPAGSLTVRYTVSQNGDVVETGHAGPRSVTLTGSSAAVTVPTVDDQTAEPNDNVATTLNDGSGYRVGAPASASVPVRDDEGYPTVTLSGAPHSVNEGNSFSLTFLASEPRMTLYYPLQVRYQVNDRGHVTERTVNFPKRGTIVTKSISPRDDNVVNPDGPLTVTIISGTGLNGQDYQVGTPNSVTVNVKETDTGTPTISLSGPASVTEGDPMVYTVTASRTPQGGSASLQYRASQNYDYAHRVDSSQLGLKAVTLTGTTATITIPTTGDDIYDGPASFSVELIGDGKHRVLNRLVTTKVIDDDPNPTITVATIPDSSRPAVTEGNPAPFTITANPAPAGNMTINYRVYEEGGFVDGSQLGFHTVVLTNSAPSATVSVPTLDDDVEERSGRVEVYITHGRGYTYQIYPDGYAVYYVDDNDQRGNPTISVTGPTQVTEGSAAAFTITSSPAPKGSLTVSYRVSQEGGYVDGSELGLQSVTVTSATTTVSIPTLGDDVDEADGSVSITLASGQGYRLDPTDYHATTTVEDDDATLPEMRIVRAQGSIDEGDSAKFHIFAEPPPVGELTVKYRVSQSGSFVADDDRGDKTLTLNGPHAAISIPTVDDDADEADGSVTVALLTSTEYTIIPSSSSAATTVNDDD